MLYFPPAKINLGLHVIEKRADGFHNLETVFYPVKLSDVLEVLPHPSTEFKLSGITIEGSAYDNLCMKAYHLLKADFDIPPVYMQLHKIIPMGAGLGGGSADAAFVLKALDSEFKLSIGKQRLKEYAARLGSDCAFFIENRPAIATGRGEILNPIDLNLTGYYLVLVKPDIHIGTAEAYSGIIPRKPAQSLADIISSPVNVWRQSLVNDFETNLFKNYPQIAAIKQKLYDLGALYAAISGSGSTVFGLFTESTDVSPYFSGCFIYCETI
ncbi:MAG: 4-(cytidine 5'-diphospho)-2-C-methyl-D-erythritol kinase [Prevotellaceae bacterium]|jgi:4-diphosphocytidyl-2-C-methyl-D-erythritol kinase|nr:4-(cytidine 5'-diphospho)-2-C-methyl-D-erythritol kinase [Prevotellaceae bacterium]